MRILSVNKGFSSAHSSVNYEFISERGFPAKAIQLVRQSVEQFDIEDNVISIYMPGERYLSDRIQETLLIEHDIPLLIYEDYDWWNFILMFNYDENLFKDLKSYKNDYEHSISVKKTNEKIQVWISVHLDYNAIDSDCSSASPFEPLRELFLEIRKRILEKDFKSLEILYTYCSGEDLSGTLDTDALEEKLKSYLDWTW